MSSVEIRNDWRILASCRRLLSSCANACEDYGSRHYQIPLLCVREQAPVRPIHRTQFQLVCEDHEGSAVAANAGLTRLRLSRSVQRPTQGMAALRALPAGDAWDGVRGQLVHSGHAACSSASSIVRQTAIHSVPWFWNTQKSRPLEEKRSPERS